MKCYGLSRTASKLLRRHAWINNCWPPWTLISDCQSKVVEPRPGRRWPERATREQEDALIVTLAGGDASRPTPERCAPERTARARLTVALVIQGHFPEAACRWGHGLASSTGEPRLLPVPAAGEGPGTHHSPRRTHHLRTYGLQGSGARRTTKLDRSAGLSAHCWLALARRPCWLARAARGPGQLGAPPNFGGRAGAPCLGYGTAPCGPETVSNAHGVESLSALAKVRWSIPSGRQFGVCAICAMEDVPGRPSPIGWTGPAEPMFRTAHRPWKQTSRNGEGSVRRVEPGPGPNWPAASKATLSRLHHRAGRGMEQPCRTPRSKTPSETGTAPGWTSDLGPAPPTPPGAVGMVKQLARWTISNSTTKTRGGGSGLPGHPPAVGPPPRCICPGICPAEARRIATRSLELPA